MKPVSLFPGVVRCSPSRAAEMQRKLDAKTAAEARIKALWPGKKRRYICRTYLFMSEATLRGQLDWRVLNREPSEKLLRLLDHYEGIARLSGKIGAVG